MMPGDTRMTGAAGVVRAACAAGADVVIAATNAAVSAPAPAVSAMVLDLRMDTPGLWEKAEPMARDGHNHTDGSEINKNHGSYWVLRMKPLRPRLIRWDLPVACLALSP
jgi:hypothetical protein